MNRNEQYFLSLNQIVEYSTATDKGRERIISQQIEPDPFRIPWYQSAKGSIKRFFNNELDSNIIENTISDIKLKKPEKDWQKTNNRVSTEALEVFKELKIPKVFREESYSIAKVELNSVNIEGVRLIISPEVIFKYSSNGENYLGAIKLHISKNKQFDFHKANIAAVLVNEFLSQFGETENAIVLPGNCFSLDVFGSRFAPAPDNQELLLEEIKSLCLDLKDRWNKAAA